MLESGLSAGKHKVTLYISSGVHKQLKIYAAVSDAPMSELAEKAINFYLNHADIVEVKGHGHTHQLHSCPECATPLVFRQGRLAPVPSAQSSTQAITEDLTLCN